MSIADTKIICRVKDMGLIDYDDAYARQKECVDQLIGGGEPVLLLCEHPPVVTLGRLADECHLLVTHESAAENKVAIRSVDRGGDTTLHAPGQLVVYPILDLKRHERDLHRFLRRLEKVVIAFLSDFDIVADRYPGQTGVWVGERKIASMGIGVRKWITFHGLSVNVNTDLSLYSMIKPCGLDVRMTSMAELKRRPMDFIRIKEHFTARFMKEFDYIHPEAY